MQNDIMQRSHSSVTPKNLLRFIILLDSFFSVYLLLYLIYYHPFDFLEYLPFYIYFIFLFFWGPLLLAIAGVSYFARMSNLSRISTNSSVYDAITLPTIQYGPVKIIFPVEREEPLDEDVD